MSLGMTIFSMFAAWIAAAIAMLWGVLRIARRHQPHTQERTFKKADQKSPTAA